MGTGIVKSVIDNPSQSAADDWLDVALRADGERHRAEYLGDDGFTSRLMARLPAPIALPKWRKPFVAVLWAGAAIGVAFALPSASMDLAHDLLRVFAHPVSFAQIALGVTMLGAATWAAAAVALRID